MHFWDRIPSIRIQLVAGLDRERRGVRPCRTCITEPSDRSYAVGMFIKKIENNSVSTGAKTISALTSPLSSVNIQRFCNSNHYLYMRYRHGSLILFPLSSYCFPHLISMFNPNSLKISLKMVA